MRPPPAPHRFPFAHSRVIRATQPLAKKTRCMRRCAAACRQPASQQCWQLFCFASRQPASTRYPRNPWKPPESIKWNAHFVRRMNFIFLSAGLLGRCVFVCVALVVLLCIVCARNCACNRCDRFAVEYFRLVFIRWIRVLTQIMHGWARLRELHVFPIIFIVNVDWWNHACD